MNQIRFAWIRFGQVGMTTCVQAETCIVVLAWRMLQPTGFSDPCLVPDGLIRWTLPTD